MKRILATLATSALLLTVAAVPAGAAPRRSPLPWFDGVPMCVATIWASHHYGVPKTPRGSYCAAPWIEESPNPGSSPGVRAYYHRWMPATWAPQAETQAPDGTYLAEIFYVPR